MMIKMRRVLETTTTTTTKTRISALGSLVLAKGKISLVRRQRNFLGGTDSGSRRSWPRSSEWVWKPMAWKRELESQSDEENIHSDLPSSQRQEEHGHVVRNNDNAFWNEYVE